MDNVTVDNRTDEGVEVVIDQLISDDTAVDDDHDKEKVGRGDGNNYNCLPVEQKNENDERKMRFSMTKQRRLFLEKIADLSCSLLQVEADADADADAETNADADAHTDADDVKDKDKVQDKDSPRGEGCGIDDEEVTRQSDLTLPNRCFVVVTTAALPWMTGTAVNPLLRAAHLCRWTKKIDETAKDNGLEKSSTKVDNNKSRQLVTLVIPWLEREEDRISLYGKKNIFHSQSEQEDYIRTWMRDEADLVEESDYNSGLKILFYPSRYHSGLGSIFAMGDICLHIPDEDSDVCILEEPEHLNWYRASGDASWTKKFNYVVGIVHTNYKEYAAGHYTGLWTAPAIKVLSSAMVRAYCHQVIKLSDVLQTYAPEKEKTCNVHGVREDFLREGARRAANSAKAGDSKSSFDEVKTKDETHRKDHAASQKATGGNDNVCRTYFIGKLLWAKGLDRLIKLEEYYKKSTGEFFKIDIYGSGPEEDEIKRAYQGRQRGRGVTEGKTANNEEMKLEKKDNSNNKSSKRNEAAKDEGYSSSSDEEAFREEQTQQLEEELSLKSNENDSYQGKMRQRLEYLSQALKSRKERIRGGLNDLPKSRHELRRGSEPIPATFPGRVDHATHLRGDQYKIFINPSVSEVLCTTTAEALAMGKFAIVPFHPSNTFFYQFPNCLVYENKLEFVANLRWALMNEPEPLKPERSRIFTWEAATERLIDSAAITRKEANHRLQLGKKKGDERIAYIHNELGKGSKGDALRKVLGAGPVSYQTKYEVDKKKGNIAGGNKNNPKGEEGEDREEDVKEEELLRKLEAPWLLSAIGEAFPFNNRGKDGPPLKT